jgi:hypothetical protein
MAVFSCGSPGLRCRPTVRRFWRLGFVALVVTFIVWERCTRPPQLSAAGFTVAIACVQPAGAPTLLSIAQDSAVAFLRASLPAAWSAATRGRGRVTVVDANPGIVLTVIAGAGESQHLSTARIQAIQIYVADDRGRLLSDAALTTTALHELGHIWCCYDGDASGGHWSSLVDDGPALGVNRFGLMNNPVIGFPNRFSDRELHELQLDAPQP